MIYVSERIVNIAELERLVESAYIEISLVVKALEENEIPIAKIVELSKSVLSNLIKAKDFEFCLEQRKTISDYCE